MSTSTPLHLPDLSIQGFRGIDNLIISRLGQVTLIAGKNSVGKTTVLEAVQVYASRGHFPVLYDLLMGREEVFSATDEDGEDVREPNWAALFHGRTASGIACISVGSANVGEPLTIEATVTQSDSLSDQQSSFMERFYPDALTNDSLYTLKQKFQGKESWIPVVFRPDDSGAVGSIIHYPSRYLPRRFRRRVPGEEPPPGIKCQFLGPGLLSNNDIARFWDSVALTDDESRATRVLSLIFGDDAERVAVIGDETIRGRYGRRVVVKLRSHDRPVPLKSLGDGALRLFGAALAIANSRGGFLLIDEAENGIHYSVHRNYWRMVLQGARDNNVQVLATTHSWDCIRGFAQAAVEEEAEGVLVRLERNGERLRAVEYSEEALHVAAEQGIEVR